MTMTEPSPPETTRPAKPKRHARANRRKPAAPAALVPSVLAGITPTDCPNACLAERCVISGRGICAHPHKGGLQASMQSPEAMRRLNEAKRILGKQKLDLTST